MIIDMKKKGSKKAMLITDKNNVYALKCYKRLGFKIDQNYFFALFNK